MERSASSFQQNAALPGWCTFTICFHLTPSLAIHTHSQFHAFREEYKMKTQNSAKKHHWIARSNFKHAMCQNANTWFIQSDKCFRSPILWSIKKDQKLYVPAQPESNLWRTSNVGIPALLKNVCSCILLLLCTIESNLIYPSLYLLCFLLMFFSTT